MRRRLGTEPVAGYTLARKMPAKTDFDRLRDKVRAICLALPDTKETLTWGSPHFRVGEKPASKRPARKP